MKRGRLEAFSDGVLAIVITIMVLEMKVPAHSTPELASLLPVLPVFLSYVLSFLYIGIYWNNHHHMMHSADHVTGAILWANLHLLFWLSLVPFVTGWLGANHVAPAPAALYGFVLLMAGIAFLLLQSAIARAHGGRASTLSRAVGRDLKGKGSLLLYVVAIPLAFVSPWLACALYLLVALLWLIPDRRIEQQLLQNDVEGPTTGSDSLS